MHVLRPIFMLNCFVLVCYTLFCLDLSASKCARDGCACLVCACEAAASALFQTNYTDHQGDVVDLGARQLEGLVTGVIAEDGERVF